MLGLAFKILCFLLGVAAAAGLLVLEGLRPEATGWWLGAIRTGETLCCGVILFALYECLLKKKLWAILIPKPVRALVATLLGLLVAAAAVLETAVVVASGHSAYPAPDDECILIPGSRLEPNGLPSPLRRKLEAAGFMLPDAALFRMTSPEIRTLAGTPDGQLETFLHAKSDAELRWQIILRRFRPSANAQPEPAPTGDEP